MAIRLFNYEEIRLGHLSLDPDNRFLREQELEVLSRSVIWLYNRDVIRSEPERRPRAEYQLHLSEGTVHRVRTQRPETL